MNMQNQIENKLKNTLSHKHVLVKNESNLHRGGEGAETHFRIEIVAAEFESKNLLDRHRLVAKILEHEFGQIKAYSLHTYSPAEWEKLNGSELPRSPTCAQSK